VEDAFWCPKDECVKNASDLMLAEALALEDAFYWEADEAKPLSLKRKWPQAEEESLNDSVLMVQTAMSAKNCLNQRTEQQHKNPNKIC